MLDYLYTSFSYIYTQFLENPFFQGVGIVAYFVSIYNFLFCKDKKFIIVTALVSCLWGVHYLGIFAISAGLINIFDVFKNLAALKWEKNKKWMWFFIVAYLIIGIISYIYIFQKYGKIKPGDVFELIPIILGIFSTYLVFCVRGIWLKFGFLGVVCFWLVYNIVSASIGGVITDTFILISSIIGIFRDFRSEKKENFKKNI